MSQLASTENGYREEKYSLEDKNSVLFRKEYLVEFEQGDDGWIVAKCPEVNVVTQGKTPEELQQNVIEAVELALGEDKQFIVRMVEKFSA